MNNCRRIASVIRAACALNGALLGLSLILGIDLPAAQGQTPPPAAVRGQAVELAEEPFFMDELGLSVRFPLGSIAQSTKIGDRRTVQIVPESTEWVINIQTPQTSNPEATIQDAADQTLALLQGAYGVTDPDQKLILETKTKVLGRTPNLKVTGGAVCERLYVSVPRADGTNLVKGYSIFKPTPNQFLVFELITSEDKFAAAQPLYEASVATATFLDMSVVNATRGSIVKAGAAFFEGLTAADYEKALTGDREIVHRLYLPARTGSGGDAQELGFRTMRFWKGQRSELGGNSGRRGGQQQGYLARIQARLLRGENVIDTEGVYFMLPDRTEEAWMLRTVVWGPKGDRLAMATETGARNGSDLNVSISDSGQAIEDVEPYVPAEGYISQFELFLLHRLMITKQIQTELGTYTYQSQSKTVSLRRDLLSAAKGGSARAAWDVQTRYRDEAAPVQFTYSAEADLLRSTLEDGSVWESADRDTLLATWRRKGLPTGTVGSRR